MDSILPKLAWESSPSFTILFLCSKHLFFIPHAKKHWKTSQKMFPSIQKFMKKLINDCLKFLYCFSYHYDSCELYFYTLLFGLEKISSAIFSRFLLYEGLDVFAEKILDFFFFPGEWMLSPLDLFDSLLQYYWDLWLILVSLTYSYLYSFTNFFWLIQFPIKISILPGTIMV